MVCLSYQADDVLMYMASLTWTELGGYVLNESGTNGFTTITNTL